MPFNVGGITAGRDGSRRIQGLEPSPVVVTRVASECRLPGLGQLLQDGDGDPAGRLGEHPVVGQQPDAARISSSPTNPIAPPVERTGPA